MTTEFFSDKTILVIVTIVGMAICSMGIMQVSAHGAWTHPFAITGYLLGALILVIAGAALLNISLPLVDSPRTAIIAVVVLGIVKVALTQIHRVFA